MIGDPEDRQTVDLGAQGLEDPTGVGVLQAEADLDAEEADAHVPDRQAGQARAVGEDCHDLPPLAGEVSGRGAKRHA
jgi:hypothetical protein